MGEWKENEVWKKPENEVDLRIHRKALRFAASTGRIDEIHHDSITRTKNGISISHCNAIFKEIPTRLLYHVTASLSAIREDQYVLLTGLQAKQKKSISLGSFNGDYISFTESLPIAKAIYREYLELSKFLRGDYSVNDFIEAAREGKGAKKSWYGEDDFQYVVESYRHAQNHSPLDSEKLAKIKTEFYKRFAEIRHHAGGPKYIKILHYATSLNILEQDIAILEYKPVEGAYGQYANLEEQREWRVFHPEGIQFQRECDVSIPDIIRSE